MKNVLKLITAIAVMLSGLMFVAPAANAETVVITARVVGSAVAEAKAISTAKATGSSYAFAAAQVRSKAEHTSRCLWAPGTNSYISGGRLVPYYDPVPAYWCKLKNPRTIGGLTYTHKKLAGGTTGTPCGNLGIPKQKKARLAAVLDVRAGTIAEVGVRSRVSVGVEVKVTVLLEYTYKGETHQITKTQTASDSATASDRDVARMKVTKRTTRRATAAKIVEAMARVETRATATAHTKAVAKARAKAVAEVEVVIEIDEEAEAPTVSVQARACVNPGEATGIIDVVVGNPNDTADTAVVTVGSQTKTVSVAANSTANLAFTGYAPGTYSVTAMLQQAGKSASTTVTVNECDVPPPPVDNAPQISCVFPAHVYVGGNVYLWCEASDSDGDALSVNIIGDEFAHVSGVIPSSIRWDGTACPAGTTCYRATLWGDKVGTSHIVATVTAGGKSATSVGDVPILVDEF